MSTKRYVDTSFWRDGYVIQLSPEQKHIFNYLLTNPSVTMCGIYELPMKIIAFETGYDVKVIPAILEKLQNDGKIAYIDEWVVLINRPKYQPIGNKDSNTAKGIQRELDAIPPHIKQRVSKDYVRGIQGAWKGLIWSSKIPILKPKPILKPNGNTTAKAAKKDTDIISKLFYEAVKALKLPITNHNTIRSKIKAMKTEDTEEELIKYLVFMRDSFGRTNFDFKPDVNTALDLYNKRMQVINRFTDYKKIQQQSQPVRFGSKK